ncbi:MAG: glucose 1-dehydrogenase [Rhodospirillaceae bacterium]|jgi:NAD(P)-dependent dehydrogenase (short-subunit alcohol dehydrogenase family)|nr:glucose 1-dehydrogenase [Rhodospirillaceae bacterium]MBT5457826.1 glucose 1-dehydrogenase [Rhodospirillaceae bacterium]
MGRLDGKVAIVTGGARSIGAAFAKGLAEEGARVVIADLDAAEETLGIIKQAGGEAMAVKTDVTQEADCNNMVAQAVEAYGRLDILVANAGLWVHLERESALEIDVETWQKVMAVNVQGVWLSARAAIPAMQKNEYGKIITVASTRAMKGGSGMLHYDASKGAVIAITRSLAREWGESGIRANVIAPGATDTEISQSLADDTQLERRVASAQARAIKRAEEPDDLVGTCQFLASPDSDFMSGQTIVVDGGAIMW